MNLPKTLGIVGAVAGAAMLASPDLVFAQGGIPNCADLDHPIYMTGTTAVTPVVQLFGARLRNVHLTLLWNSLLDGCGSVGDFLSTSVDTAGATLPVYSYYQEMSGKVVASQCNGARAQKADLAINDVGYSSCAGNPPLPATVAEFPGPVQGVVPIVPSTYFAYNDVMAEELQAMYICGPIANVLGLNPIYDYSGTRSGLRELFTRDIGLSGSVSVGPWTNPVDPTAETMVNLVSSAGGNTFGYTSTEFYDLYRDRVNALKVRGVGQKLAYWPDSDKTNTDKINIREGRYTLQGTLRLVTKVDGSGVPTNPTVKHIIDWFQQNPIDPSLQLPFDVTEIYAKGGVVPRCAMKVTNDGDSAVFKHFKPAQPCHCAFQVLATGKANIPGCVPCSGGSAGAVDGGVADGGGVATTGTCAANQICSHGYCEQP